MPQLSWGPANVGATGPWALTGRAWWQHGNFGASHSWSFVLLCFVLSPHCKGKFLFVPVPGEFVFWLIKERL